MARIPEETIEQVLAATDIVDVISGYIPLKRAGGSFKALCPFHNEKTPSFNITPSRQSFHCFGCGESGSAIGFVMKYENLPFVDAVKKLADKAGVPIIEEVYDPQAEQRRRSKSRLIELHNAAAQYFHSLVRKSPQAQHARDYLKKRGFSKESAERWLIGWMPENPKEFLDWARENNFRGRDLVDAGLAALKAEGNPKAGIYVRFRNRLMFPIHNDYGDIIAFSGRQLVNDPNSGKYINSPQTQIFDKSRVFFGLDKARRHMTKEKFALICEGQIDAISCHEQGIQNAIAPLGTAFTEHHARLLKRYTDTAILCFDADSAGHKAAQRAFSILVPAGIHVRCASMPEGEDPDSYIQKHGAEAFKTLLDEAQDFFDYKLTHASKAVDLADIREKSNLAKDLANLARLVTDKVTLDSVISKVAARLGVGDQDFRSMVFQADKQQYRVRNYDNVDDSAPEKAQATPMDNTISYLCFLALNSSEVMEWLCEQLEALHEPMSQTPGGHVLAKILARKPNPSNPASIQTYLLGIEESDRLALQSAFSENLPDNPVSVAEGATSMLISNHLQHKDAIIRAALKQPGLGMEEMTDLLRQAEDVRQLLSNLNERYIR
ncbi:DNA primase [Rubritalea halochordaticola]|uniref:DNA primase n=1 Tax=Rubritalea halochordaticola TaxID=714537 RepID=A0ABP9UUR8_9BACT